MKKQISQSDSIEYSVTGFDNQKYFDLQKEKILERIGKFKKGRLYMEIGGKFLFDAHASRVLPGFKPTVKKKIFASLKDHADILFCVDYKDIVENRQLSNEEESYTKASLGIAQDIHLELGVRPDIVINLCEQKKDKSIEKFIDKARGVGYKVYFRHRIEGYPHDTGKILSNDGFGRDDYAHNGKPLVLVTGAASNSGKMSTCIGQIYLDHVNGIDSGYAKFETFPIWNLPLKHPINLAYEAATADIGDYNEMDHYHKEAHGIDAVNYNRDVNAFELLMELGSQIVSESNFIRNYKSPTDMGINHAGFAITDDEIVSIASLHEIDRRKKWYQEIIDRDEGEEKWLTKCDELKTEAMFYIKEKGYNLNLNLA